MTNYREAIWDTLQLASERKRGANYVTINDDAVGWLHLNDMWKIIESTPDMSDTKLCRWLGWIQASVVSWGTASLDDMKEINKKYAD